MLTLTVADLTRWTRIHCILALLVQSLPRIPFATIVQPSTVRCALGEASNVSSARSRHRPVWEPRFFNLPLILFMATSFVPLPFPFARCVVNLSIFVGIVAYRREEGIREW